MKKIVYVLSFLFLFRFFWLPEISWAVSVSDLYPAAAVFSAATKTWNIPAKIEVVTDILKSESTVALAMDLTKVSSLGALVAVAGFVYAGSELFDYLLTTTNPHLFYDHNLSPPVLSKLAPSGSPGCDAGLGSIYSFVGNFSDAAAAAAAVIAAGALSASSWGYNGCASEFGSAYYGGYPDVPHGYYAIIGSGSLINVPATEAVLQIQLAADISAGNVNGAAAQRAAYALLLQASSVFPSGQPNLNLQTFSPTSVNGSRIKAIFSSALTPSQLQAAVDLAAATNPDQSATDVADKADQSSASTAAIIAALQSQGLSANAIAAAVVAASAAGVHSIADMQAAIANVLISQGLSATAIAAAIGAIGIAQGLTEAQSQAATAAALAAAGLTAAQIGAAVHAANPELTQAQIQAAVAAALTATLGADVAAPEDVLPVVPDKLSLTTIMESFLTSIAALPMFSTLHGLHINCGGSSVLCMNLPSKLGGNACFDVSGAVGGINMAGQAMLSITTIMMFVWVFRG
jgi:hypothetical protein